MPWFKVDAHAHEHPKIIALRKRTKRRADAACWGWLLMLAAAKRYGDWTFRSEEHLADSLGNHARFIDDYRVVGLLDGLTVHDGEGFQNGSEQREAWRERKRRQRQRPGDVTRDSRAPARLRAFESESESEIYIKENVLDQDAPARELDPEEARKALNAIREGLIAKGVLPASSLTPDERRYPVTTDEEVIAKARAIISDPDAPDWKREAARAQLEAMRVET